MESDKEEDKKDQGGEKTEPAKEPEKVPVDWGRKDVVVQEDDGDY